MGGAWRSRRCTNETTSQHICRVTQQGQSLQNSGQALWTDLCLTAYGVRQCSLSTVNPQDDVHSLLGVCGQEGYPLGHHCLSAIISGALCQYKVCCVCFPMGSYYKVCLESTQPCNMENRLLLKKIQDTRNTECRTMMPQSPSK